MLTNVNFSCGHSAEVNLSNNEQKRLEKIAELELTGLCPECRKAEWEKEDAKNSFGCCSVLISEEAYKEQYPQCKERLTGVPSKDKGFTFIYLPLEEIIIEALKNYINTHNVTCDEALRVIKDKFAVKYPDEFNKFKPITIEEDVKPAIKEKPAVSEKPVNAPQMPVVKPAEEKVSVPAEIPKTAPIPKKAEEMKVPAAPAPAAMDIDDPYSNFDSSTYVNEPAVPAAPVAPVTKPETPVVEKAAESKNASVDDIFGSLNDEFEAISNADLDKDLPSVDADLDAFLNELDGIEASAPSSPVMPEPVINNSKAAVEVKEEKPAANNNTASGGSDDLGAELDSLLADLM